MSTRVCLEEEETVAWMRKWNKWNIHSRLRKKVRTKVIARKRMRGTPTYVKNSF